MDLLLFVSENNLLIDDSDVFRKNIMEIQSRLNISCRLIKLKKDFSLLSDSEDTVYVVRIHKELSKGELFYLKAKGDSMSDFIHDGDLVGIDVSQTEIIDGEIYAVYFEGEGMIKQIFKAVNMILS